MITTSGTAVREYLTRVRTLLADIPATELEELLDDVRLHLNEIAEELGANAGRDGLVGRLGTPESYAAELRAAGEYPEPPSRPAGKRSTFAPRIALWGVTGSVMITMVAGYFTVFDASVGAAVAGLFVAAPLLAVGASVLTRRGADSVNSLAEVRAARSLMGGNKAEGFLRSLAPGWWLASAVLMVAAAVLLLGRGGENVALVVPLFGALAALAVIAGARLTQNRNWLWVALPISGLTVGIGLGGLSLLSQGGFTPATVYAYSDASYNNATGLWLDGREVNNLYAFDADGTPITDFYLFDSAGQPVLTPRQDCAEFDASFNGVPAKDNQYPRPRIMIDGTSLEDYRERYGYPPFDQDSCSEETDVPFTVAIPAQPEDVDPAQPEGDAVPEEGAPAPTTEPGPTG